MTNSSKNYQKKPIEPERDRVTKINVIYYYNVKIYDTVTNSNLLSRLNYNFVAAPGVSEKYISESDFV